MTQDQTVALANRLAPELPPGWGFLAHRDDDGQACLLIAHDVESEPVARIIWLVKELQPGIRVQGSVVFWEGEEPELVEARVWLVLQVLTISERREAARWN